MFFQNFATKMVTNFELTNEVKSLRVELEEKQVQIDAMMQFESELTMKVEELMKKKDYRIKELEARVEERSTTPGAVDDTSNALFNLLREREQEVEILESRVKEIMAERKEQDCRDSISDSLIEYEQRVDVLRRELYAKDCEINQLRHLLDTVPSPAISPDHSKELDSLRDRLCERESENEELRQKLNELRSLPTQNPCPVPTPKQEPRLSLTAQTIALSPRTVSRTSRGLSQISTPNVQLLPSASIPAMEGFSERLTEEVANRRRVETENESLRLSLKVATSNRSKLEADILALGESVASEKLRLESELKSGIARCADLEKALQVGSEQITKLRTENKELLRSTAVCSDEVRIELADLRQALKSKDHEIRVISSKLVELKKDIKLTEQQREVQEHECHKLQRVIEGLKARKPAANEGPNELEKLRADLEELKRKTASRGPVKQQRITTPSRILKLSVHSSSYAVIPPCIGNDEPAVSRTPVQHQLHVINRLQTQLMFSEAELAQLKKKILLDEQLELDIERLKCRKFENECVTLAARVEDLEHQLERRALGNELMRLDDVALRAQLEARHRDSLIQQSRDELEQARLECVRAKNKVLELEFDQVELKRMCERFQEYIDVLKTVDQTQEMREVPDGSKDKLEQLQQANERLVEERKTLLKKVNDEELASLRSKVRELQLQRDADRDAIADAQRVLSLVEQTESKYVRVAKENAKLRKELAALNDDTFWNDLEALQTQHKRGVGLLMECKNHLIDPKLVRAIDSWIGQ